MAGKSIEFRVAMRPGKCRAVSVTHEGSLQDLVEGAKARIRVKVERPFRVIKPQFGFNKTSLRGFDIRGPRNLRYLPASDCHKKWPFGIVAANQKCASNVI
jgi:hypothetical protein